MKLSVRGAALVAAAFVIGCASADKPSHCGGGNCDLGTGVGGNSDEDMAETPLPMPDMTPGLLGFGDSCNDNKDCKSGICVQTSTGGVCTDLCPDDMCPPGYGCLGVTGQIDPGTVTYVCVPNTTTLCTPCSGNGECSVGGHDWCLPTPVGGHFCGRDCSKIACPGGFSCQDVGNGDMGNGKQCVPTSGSCDCDASKAGMTVPCDITTPTGVCQGTRTCMGASGWGTTCNPPSGTDGPDDNYKDDNCDGIDGNAGQGVFVAKGSAAAVDDATCGSMVKPCKSINWGISQAANNALRFVYVQAAVYNEEVVLFNGIDIVGGYDTNWQRASRGTGGHDVVITGAFDSTEGQFISVLAHSLSAQTTLWDLDVYGPNANDGAHAGYSSYAVHALNAKLRLHRVGIFGGNGGDGRVGTNGTNAATLVVTTGMNGYVAPPTPPGPGNADEHSTACDNSGRGRGGDAGANSCPDDDNPNDGPDGADGTMDTSCSCALGVCVCNNCSATAGLGGSSAATTPAGGYGAGGPGGAGGDGTSQGGFAANSGRVLNGAGGSSDSRRAGSIINNYWYAFGGLAGVLGKNGTGGGGGGGSGGDDSGIDSWGAGGGGGAAGGCRARAPGTGGGGGGGSFGVFAVSSTITTEMCAFQIGNGGAGGSGGRGGTGQNGGAGAPGGLASGDSKAGGPGGNGAHGGHSGGGGGGNGGIAYGIFTLSSTVNDSSTYTGGAAGARGSGGPAASPAPGGSNDGSAGADGFPGLSNGSGTCAAAGGC